MTTKEKVDWEKDVKEGEKPQRISREVEAPQPQETPLVPEKVS